MSIYSLHPSIAYAQAGLRTIEEKTGRTIYEWVEYINKNGPKAENERKQWLKEKFDLGTNQAGWLAEYSSGGSKDWFDENSYLKMAEEYVEKMYAGKKEALRPLYDKLLTISLGIGKEATASPCATMVPIYRTHVIAQIKPSTNSRVDMGFALGDLKPTGRLIDTGGFAKKDRITHRIAISSLSDIDNEVKLWLKKAYDRDSK